MKRLAIAVLAAFLAGYLAGQTSASSSAPGAVVQSGQSGPPLDSAVVPTAASGDDRAVGAPSPVTRPSIDASEPSASAVSVRGTPSVGIASWYADPRLPADGLYAAVPGFDGRDFPAQVCGFEGGRTNCVIVLVRDFCRCVVGRSERIVDLSPAAFASLAPLSKGLVRVTVERLP